MADTGRTGDSRGPPGVRTYAVHGIRVSLASEWSEFLALGNMMLGAFGASAATDESLSVRLDVRLRPWLESPRSLAVREGIEERLGTAEFREGESARLKTDRYTIDYADGRDAAVRAAYVLDRRNRLRKILSRAQPWQDLFSLFRLAVQEPILLKLERRGMVLLHASVAAQDDRALVLLGLNGSGKSSLCANLLDRLDYVSDNFAAWDGRRILGFPSALRLPGDASGVRVDIPSLHGKSFVQPDSRRIRLTAEPRALVFVSLGGATSLTPIAAKESYSRLLEIADMTHEFPRHSFLGPLASLPDLGRIQALAESVPAYRLVMSRTEEARGAVLGIL